MSKARLATVISITSITFTILLIGMFSLFSINLHNWIKHIREKIEMEVFIQVNADDAQIKSLEKQLIVQEGVDSVSYISKDQAAERFKQEFGEDVISILEFNPFPASFIIHLAAANRTAEGARQTKTKIEKLDHVNEVVYQEPLLLAIDKYVDIIYLILVFTTFVILAIAVILINNTIRLTIYARRDIIQIMRLVGATEGFIRRPFIVEGMILGILGASIAALMVYYLIKLIKAFLFPYLIFNPLIFAALVIFGFVIGTFSSYISVGKYMRNIY
jgi:cell division transport system permease protein